MKRMWLSGLALLAAALGAAADTQAGLYELTPIQDTAKTMSIRLFPTLPEAEFIRLAGGREAAASINTFLLRGEGKIILVDAGNGGRVGKTLMRLRELGVAPEQVDAVLLTHMHGDHIGGLIDEDGRAVFPKAELFVSAPERDFREKEPGSGGELARRVLAAYGERVKELRDGQEPMPGIRALAAPGHTPGHTVLEVGDLYLVADLVHAASVQVQHPEVCAIYDMDPQQAAATRVRILDLVSAPGKTVAGAHLPFPGIGRITKDAKGYTYIPEIASSEISAKPAPSEE